MSKLDREQQRIADSTVEMPGLSQVPVCAPTSSWYDRSATGEIEIDPNEPGYELEEFDDSAMPARGRSGGPRIALTAIVCIVVGLLGGAGGLAIYSWWTKPLPVPPPAAAPPPAPVRPNADAVRTQLRDIAEYQAAQADYKTQVPIGGNGRLGRQITGDSAMLDATGKVNATVDFRNLGAHAIKVSDDGKSVTVTLPHARVGEVSIDYNRTQVTQRQRGIWTRMTAKELDPGPAYNQAGANIRADAEKSDLSKRAEENTRAMLTGLLNSLGFQSVEVRFEDPKG